MAGQWFNNLINQGKDYVMGTQAELNEFLRNPRDYINTNVNEYLNAVNRDKVKNGTISRGQGSYVVGDRNKIDRARTTSQINNLYNKVNNIAENVETPKMNNLGKQIANVGGKALGALGAAIDVPTTIRNWNAEGANLGSRILDSLGTAYAGLTGLALGVNPLISVGMGYATPAFHNAAQLAREGVGIGNLNTQEQNLQDIQNQLRAVGITPTDLNDVQSGGATIQDIVKQSVPQGQRAQAKTQKPSNTAPTTNTEEFIRQLVAERGLSVDKPQTTQVQNNQTLTQTAPAASTTNVNTSPNVNTPTINLTPVNGAPTMANQNQDLPSLNNIQTMSNYVAGLQQGFQQPVIPPSQEELSAYQNLVNQLGQQAGGVQARQDAIDEAARRDRLNRQIATGLDIGNAIVQGLRSPQENTFAPLWTGQVVQLSNAGNRGREQYRPVAQEALAQQQSNIQNQVRLNALQQANEQQAINRARELANIQSALRTSQATGLPLAVTANMDAGDYVSYLNPNAQARSALAQIAARGIAGDIATQADNAAQMERLLTQEGGLNARAAAQLQTQAEIAEADRQLKERLLTQQGVNAMALEQLRQQDPAAYLNAMSQIINAGTYYNLPQSQAFLQSGYGLMNYLMPQYFPQYAQQQQQAQVQAQQQPTATGADATNELYRGLRQQFNLPF